MATFILVKNGERVLAHGTVQRDTYIAQGYVLETNPEQDPRDLEAAFGVQRSKGTLKLPVLSGPPAGPNAVGEVYVFTDGILRICTVAGSPGTWVNVGTQV